MRAAKTFRLKSTLNSNLQYTNEISKETVCTVKSRAFVSFVNPYTARSKLKQELVLLVMEVSKPNLSIQFLILEHLLKLSFEKRTF